MRPYAEKQVYACCKHCGVAPQSRHRHMQTGTRRWLRRLGKKAVRRAVKDQLRTEILTRP